VPAAAAIQIALSTLGGSRGGLRGDPQTSLAYVRQGKEAVLSWQVVLPLQHPLGTWLVAIEADSGQVMFDSELTRWDEGRVFDPNPVKSSGGTFPPPAHCDSAGTEPSLSSEYILKPLSGIQPGQDKLIGEFVDLTAPGIIGGYKPAGQADELSGSYVYPCLNDRFEEVMVYYHVDATQRKIQSLGYSGPAAIAARSVPAHAHYFADCNAFYDPATRGLHFGDSTTCGSLTDTAEDADVIVHEYGHAIQDDQIPALGFGLENEAEEAWALGEGFSDFLTAALFGDSCVSEWANFGSPPCLRELENTKVYPADYDACRFAPPFPAEPHCAGLIWGGALWDLVQALGGDQHARDLVLTIVLESHFMLHPLTTLHEAASAVRDADALLYGGAHEAAIDAVFAARGLTSLSAISDFPNAYLRIDHTYRGDLDVDLLVGSISTPVCAIAVFGPNAGDGADDLVGYEHLGGSPCEPLLPPSVAQPWFLRVQDMTSGNVGTLEEFQIALNGKLRCLATGLPASVPDAGAPVYSQIDCTTTVTGAPVDDDGDGFSNPVELYLSTSPSLSCGPNNWPADLNVSPPSANKLDILDLASYIAPVRHFNTSPGDAAFAIKWDIVPGAGVLPETINLQDLAFLVTFTPPMFGGARAYNKSCQ